MSSIEASVPHKNLIRIPDQSVRRLHRTRTGRGQPTGNIWPAIHPSPRPRTMAVAQAAAPAVAAAAAHTVYLPAACRGIPPRAPNGTTTGVFRWRPRRRTLARARPARRGGRPTGRGRGLVVVAEFGGTYEDGFEDVHKVHNM